MVEIQRDDLQAWVPLFMHVFNQPPWSDGWTADTASERLQALAATPYFLGLGLTSRGQPVALAIGWRERWTDGWTYYLKEFCVAPELQGQGLGSQLLQALETRLRDLDCTSYYLHTQPDTPAEAFYRRLGLQPESYVALGKQLS